MLPRDARVLHSTRFPGVSAGAAWSIRVADSPSAFSDPQYPREAGPDLRLDFGRGSGHWQLFTCHLSEDLVHIPPKKAAVAAQRDQAGEEALGRPSAYGLGRYM